MIINEDQFKINQILKEEIKKKKFKNPILKVIFL
jgi:hypothetical protein